MKRWIVLFFIFLLLVPSVVSANSYRLPGETQDKKQYNNIGLLGEVMMDVNVTILNTASFPKFVIINPRYSFRVYRNVADEYLLSLRTPDGKFLNVGLPNLKTNTLNYFAGFWVMPYETVVVNFWLDYNNSYVIKTEDYSSRCGEVGKLSNVTYVNGSFAGGRIYSLDDITSMVCGIVYPQLINVPKVMYVDSLFPLNDGHVKVLKYDGLVRFRITNVPNEGGDFYTFFAFAPPILFGEGEMYDFAPNYTMTYRDYMEIFIWKYRGIEKPEAKAPQLNESSSTQILFSISPALITGVSTAPEIPQVPKVEDMNFPLWVVFMNRELEIRYKIKWREGW